MMDWRSTRAPFLVTGALLIGIAAGVATVALLDLGGAVSFRVPPEQILPIPEDLAEVVRRPVEPIHGVDLHSPGPGALPGGPRPAERPPLEMSRALLERSTFGKIPRRSAEGTVSATYYASSVAEDLGRPLVAIIITELGLDQELTAQAAAFPSAVTFAFSPYISTASDWQRFMRWHGHEVLTMLPLRSLDTIHDDQGSLAIVPDWDTEEKLAGLRKVMSRGGGYVGLAGAARSFGASPEQFHDLAEDLALRGLSFIELGGRHLAQIASETGLPYLSVELALDQELSPSAIDSRLQQLEDLARSKGTATAYSSPIPLVLDRIWSWSTALPERGLTLVPVSHLLGAPG